MRLPEWLFRDVPINVAGWSLIVCLVATVVWGSTTIAAAVRDRDRPGRRPFWQTFRFWLGVFLIWCDAMFYGIVGIGILREPERADLWAVLLTGSWGVVTIIAFALWAREEKESRS